jgi:hypothetical protein
VANGAGEKGGDPTAATPEARGRAILREPGDGVGHIVDAEAHVMNSLTRSLEEAGDFGVRIERLDELKIGVAAVQVREAHPAALDLFARDDGEAEPVAEVGKRALGTANDDGDVIEATQNHGHRIPVIRAYDLTAGS